MRTLPVHVCLSMWLAAVPAAASAGEPTVAATLNPQEIIRTVETKYQGDSSHAVATMRVVTESWTREMKLEMWSEGRDKFLARILEPKKDSGTTTLRVEDEMWNYLPKIDRLMKIPASLMGNRWMGSNLSNDDLVREVKVDELYTFKVLDADAKSAHIEATPKPDAAVVWGKVLYRVDLEKKVPVEVTYYDEDGDLMRTIAFEDVRQIGNRWIPMRMVVKPADEPAESTVLAYESLDFETKIPAATFSVRSLRRR